MNINISCEFENIEFAERAVSQLKNLKKNIKNITLTTKKNDISSPYLFAPLASVGVDIYNGPGKGGFSPDSATFSNVSIFQTSGLNYNMSEESNYDKTCKVKIKCDMSIKDEISHKLTNLGGLNIKFFY